MAHPVLTPIERISRDDMLLRVAAVISQRGTCLRASVGAVIALEGRILSTGYVGSPRGGLHCTDEGVGCLISDGGCIRTVHAEANAIAFAALVGVPLRGASIYCTHGPCLNCAKLIINAGITRMVFELQYRDRSGQTLLEQSGLVVEHHVYLEGVD